MQFLFLSLYRKINGLWEFCPKMAHQHSLLWGATGDTLSSETDLKMLSSNVITSSLLLRFAHLFYENDSMS